MTLEIANCTMDTTNKDRLLNKYDIKTPEDLTREAQELHRKHLEINKGLKKIAESFNK